MPLRLSQQAGEAAHQLRVARAYEGLYLDELHNTDTERLELHSLAALPGWPADLRLEIRDYSFSGRLHDSLGPDDAPIRKVLIRGRMAGMKHGTHSINTCTARTRFMPPYCTPYPTHSASPWVMKSMTRQGLSAR